MTNAFTTTPKQQSILINWTTATHRTHPHIGLDRYTHRCVITELSTGLLKASSCEGRAVDYSQQPTTMSLIVSCDWRYTDDVENVTNYQTADDEHHLQSRTVETHGNAVNRPVALHYCTVTEHVGGAERQNFPLITQLHLRDSARDLPLPSAHWTFRPAPFQVLHVPRLPSPNQQMTSN